VTPPVQGEGDPSMSQIGVYLPNNLKEALFLLAHERSEPRESTSASSLARDYIRDGLSEEDDLPEEVLDLLDDDLVANAGGEDAEEVDA